MVDIIRVSDEPIPSKKGGVKAKGDYHAEVKEIISAMEEVPSEFDDESSRQYLEAAFTTHGDDAEKNAKVASVRANALRRAGFLVLVRENRVFVFHATDEEKAAFAEKLANRPKRKPRKAAGATA
jgi:hypothetical protein